MQHTVRADRKSRTSTTAKMNGRLTVPPPGMPAAGIMALPCRALQTRHPRAYTQAPGVFAQRSPAMSSDPAQLEERARAAPPAQTGGLRVGPACCAAGRCVAATAQPVLAPFARFCASLRHAHCASCRGRHGVCLGSAAAATCSAARCPPCAQRHRPGRCGARLRAWTMRRCARADGPAAPRVDAGSAARCACAARCLVAQCDPQAGARNEHAAAQRR